MYLKEHAPHWREVHAEVPITAEPLRVDDVLTLRARAPRDPRDEGTGLRGLWRAVREVMLVDFKRRARGFRRGELMRLFAYRLLWCSVHALAPTDVAVARVVPRVNKPLREELLTRATTLAWASIHARRKFVLQSETASEAKVPAALDESSRVLRDRMLRLVTYHFEDHPSLGPVVSYLRGGVGYLDRGNDLEELAEIYREHGEVIAHDPKHYRASDEADARDTARALYRALGITRDEKRHDGSALQGELWPALKEAYADLHRVGLFLSRDESLFPGLIAAVRARRAAPAKAGDPEQDPVPAPQP